MGFRPELDSATAGSFRDSIATSCDHATLAHPGSESAHGFGSLTFASSLPLLNSCRFQTVCRLRSGASDN